MNPCAFSLHAGHHGHPAVHHYCPQGPSHLLAPCSWHCLWCLCHPSFLCPHDVCGGVSHPILAMAFDRFVAICIPLHYKTMLTWPVVGRIAVAIVTRSFCIIFPVIFLLHRSPFCRPISSRHLLWAYWSGPLACADITINIWYGFLSAHCHGHLGRDPHHGVILTDPPSGASFCPPRMLGTRPSSTCGSHLCVILMFYVPSFFTLLTHRFGRNIPRHVHILLANLYVVVPQCSTPLSMV